MLVFLGCEYFNAPIQPFIDMNTAKVSLDAVNAGVPLGGIRFIEHKGGPANAQVPVALYNPQNFNIKVAVKSAMVNGGAASNVSVAGWSANGATVLIENAQKGQRYDIALRITSKDGVENGERVFDVPLSPVLFNSPLEAEIPNTAISLSASPLPANLPIAHWKTQKAAAHLGINKMVIEYKYFDAVTKITQKKSYTYGWNDSAALDGKLREADGGAAQGFLASDAGEYWDCSFLLPYGPSEPVTAALTTSSVLGCSFKVTVYDDLGLFAEAQSAGFDHGYGTYEARLADKAYKPTLAQAIADSPAGTETAPAVIELLNPVQVSSSYTISGGKHIKLTSVDTAKPITLTRQTGFTGFLFVITSGSSIALEHVALNGSKAAVNSSAALINVNSGAKLFLKDGSVLRDNKNSGNGGGVYSGGDITISGNAVISGNESATTGGGVYLAGGSLTLNNEAKINGNRADSGGGVYLAGGSLTLNNAAKINGNRANGGGGVWVYGGTLTMNSGSVNENISNGDAGGIACGQNSSGVFMNGGTISGNSAGNGTGVWIAFSKIFTMTGGQISNNTGGACVFVDSGIFDMQGGSINGNSSSAFGINGWGGSSLRTLKMGGTAYIAPDNPVSFNDLYMTLEVTSPLTGMTPAATITPAAYAAGTQMLTGSGVAASHSRFAITPNGAVNYAIDAGGKLQVQP